jgi:hypothetical protein
MQAGRGLKKPVNRDFPIAESYGTRTAVKATTVFEIGNVDVPKEEVGSPWAGVRTPVVPLILKTISPGLLHATYRKFPDGSTTTGPPGPGSVLEGTGGGGGANGDPGTGVKAPVPESIANAEIV